MRLRTTTKNTKRPIKIAKKTLTYLDKLQQKYIIDTPTSTTTQPTTTLNLVQTSGEHEEGNDHPSSHLRPLGDQALDVPEIPRSGNTDNDRSNIRGVQLVTPVYGEFTPSSSNIGTKPILHDPR